MNITPDTNNTDNTDSNSTGKGSKRSSRLGIAAGLLAGGAIGLVATVPSLTSAASDDSGEAVAVVQDDTGATGDTAEARPEPGAQLREVLQPLVDDGTITGSQADAVTTHLVENRPDRDGRPGERGRRNAEGRGPNGAIVAEILGLDNEALRAELAAGNSIADVAEANGIDVQDVIDALIADAESRLDEAVAQGLDEDKAAERLEQLTERITEGVNHTRPADG